MTPTNTPEAARLAEEAKRLARQLSSSAYSQGVADERDSWKQQEKYDKQARDQLAQLSASIDALAALAKQDAAPTSAARIDIGPWAVTETGNVISADFKHDVVLGISGDFADKAERMAYGRWLADTLNAAPTSASTVPAGFWLAPMEMNASMHGAAVQAHASFGIKYSDKPERIWVAVRDSYLARNPGACSVTDGEA